MFFISFWEKNVLFNLSLQGKHNEVTEPAGERLSCNGVEMIREYRSKPACTEDQDYVYDVYYAEGVTSSKLI